MGSDAWKMPDRYHFSLCGRASFWFIKDEEPHPEVRKEGEEELFKLKLFFLCEKIFAERGKNAMLI